MDKQEQEIQPVYRTGYYLEKNVDLMLKPTQSQHMFVITRAIAWGDEDSPRLTSAQMTSDGHSITWTVSHRQPQLILLIKFNVTFSAYKRLDTVLHAKPEVQLLKTGCQNLETVRDTMRCIWCNSAQTRAWFRQEVDLPQKGTWTETEVTQVMGGHTLQESNRWNVADRNSKTL